MGLAPGPRLWQRGRLPFRGFRGDDRARGIFLACSRALPALWRLAASLAICGAALAEPVPERAFTASDRQATERAFTASDWQAIERAFTASDRQTTEQALTAGDRQKTISEPRARELERLVRQDCGSCHGMTLKGGLGPDIRPERFAGVPVEAIAKVILDGVPGTPMPPWRPLLKEEDAAWIAHYLSGGTNR